MPKLSLLFPQTATNEFKGYRIAILVFALLTAMVIVRSCIHIFAPDGGAQSIATIPLDTYSEVAAGNFISLFALWGQSQLLLGLLFLIVLLRYRGLIPLCFLLTIIEWGGRLLIGMHKPMETVETAPGAAANLPIAVIALIMLVLSLIERKQS